MTDFDYEQLRPRIAARFASAADVPKEIYSDPVIYREELHRIFYGKFWHMVAHRAELPTRHSFKTTWLGEVPLLVQRDGDDQIRVFVNSCAHRGPLLEQRPFGQAKEFECPYHRWLYNEKGQFCGAPGRKEFRPDFRDEDYGLRVVRVAEHCGLIFVTMSPETRPLPEYLGSAAQPLTDTMLDDGKLVLLGYQRAIFHTNWKVFMDNDPYHGPMLHKAFRLLNWQGGAGQLLMQEPEGHMCINYQVTPYKDNGYFKDPSVLESQGTDTRANIIAIRPLNQLTKHVDTINVRFARPLGADRLEVHYAFFGHESDSPEFRAHRIRQSSNLLGPSGFVSIEDAAMFQRTFQTAGDLGQQHLVKGTGKPRSEWSQNDEAPVTMWWEHYRNVMGFVS